MALLQHLLFCAGLAALSACAVRLMIALGVMDQPNARKAHAAPVPKGGGVGVVAAFLTGVAVLYGVADVSRLAEPYFRGVIAASATIAVVSYLDDVRDWPFTVKLAAQVGAAVVAVGSGLHVDSVSLPGWGPVPLGWAGIPATLLWILVVTNAVNFMDGLNGLVSGTCLIACAFLAWLAQAQGGWFVYLASLMLAAGLAGFLPFNFPRARIFLGDVGSQFCGFVLAVLGIAAGRFSGVDMSALMVPMLLSGLLWDVGFTLARRAISGDRLHVAHRSHLFQLAHRSGVSAVRLTLLHWGFAVWGGLCCVLFVAAPAWWKPLAALLVAPPQLVWTAWVWNRAMRAGIGPW